MPYPPGYPNPWIAHNPEVTWDKRYPTHPRIHKSGRYASYWNGFSLSMNSLLIFAAARCEELVAFPNKQSESNVVFAFAFPQCKLSLGSYVTSYKSEYQRSQAPGVTLCDRLVRSRCDIMWSISSHQVWTLCDRLVRSRCDIVWSITSH